MLCINCLSVFPVNLNGCRKKRYRTPYHEYYRRNICTGNHTKSQRYFYYVTHFDWTQFGNIFAYYSDVFIFYL